jgi:hypothetical protein
MNKILIVSLLALLIIAAAPEPITPQLHVAAGWMNIDNIEGLKYPGWWYTGYVAVTDNEDYYADPYEITLTAISADDGYLYGTFCRENDLGYKVTGARIEFADDAVPVFFYPGTTYYALCDTVYMPMLIKE